MDDGRSSSGSRINDGRKTSYGSRISPLNRNGPEPEMIEAFWRRASALKWNSLCEERSTSMKSINKRISNAFLAACMLCSVSVARADVVTEWNALMQQTVAVAPSNPNLQTRWGAITQLAVFEAVNSITGDYVPYIGTIVAPPGASAEAAAIVAAHNALVGLRPFSAATLTPIRDLHLSAIPDSQAKADGIAVGEAAAAAMLALRENDGWNAPSTYVPGDGPGVWRPVPVGNPPTLPAPLLPGWGQVTPFGLESGSQFRLQAPPHLQTEKYANDLNEVKLLGRVDSPFRSQDRTDVAKVYASASPVLVWNAPARQISVARGYSVSKNARNFALLAMAMVDASIAMWDTKYTYSFWRPTTAIQLADTDGNPLTEADPTWTPLINTPAHPSYASGHASVSGAAKAVVEELFGKDGHSITVSTPAVPGVVLHYTSWDEVTNDIDDARIYGGIHYRFDQEKGAHLGMQVGKYILKNHLAEAK